MSSLAWRLLVSEETSWYKKHEEADGHDELRMIPPGKAVRTLAISDDIGSEKFVRRFLVKELRHDSVELLPGSWYAKRLSNANGSKSLAGSSLTLP
jgi:hypothetical protein